MRLFRLLALIGLAPAAQTAFATSGMPSSEIYGTEAACELYRRGGAEAVMAAPAVQSQGILLVTPFEVVGSDWRCTPVGKTYGYETALNCTSGTTSFPSSAMINTSGAGTLSAAMGGVRNILRECGAKSNSTKFFTFTSGGGKALVYNGMIEPGDFDLFLAALNTARANTVIIDSPGGDVREAIRIGLETHRRGLNTHLRSNHICASACALIFFAGQRKFLSRSASIGLHMARTREGDPSLAGTSLIEGYLLAMGVPAGVLSRMYSYGPEEMLWLSEDDKRSLNVINLWP
jgi:hypothetical protein